MSSPTYHPWLHRFAVITAVVSLLPIIMGALVTTFDAGMAFPDWPSSDGHNMFFYPWLESAGDQFLEHGHRLAGSLIGFISILLFVIAMKTEERKWVKVVAFSILIGIIIQGILGGVRVLVDERVMALIHASFAAIVFTLISCLILFTSRSWLKDQSEKQDEQSEPASFIKPISALLPLIIFGQYIVGGMLRHLGRSVFEHIALAILVLLFAFVLNFQTRQTNNRWLIKSANWTLLTVLLQVSLGVGAFITKYGMVSMGYVAVQHSPIQITFRSTHTIIGMIVLMTSVIHMIRVYRVASEKTMTEGLGGSISPIDSLSVKGGLS
jgi:heme a synthase